MSEPELARYLNLSLRTVQRWRVQGKGPPVLWAHNRPRYRKSDVDAWLARKSEEEGR